MRYAFIDTETDQTRKSDEFELLPNGKLPPHIKAYYMPRIRCTDCATKIYTAGPGQTVDNFEVHLKNRGHIANRERRTGRSNP
jgi:SWI/SNF-related matrix-associated actin-dependent regulator of chromatin subfamily B protein 1